MKSKALPHILLAVVLALAAGVLTIRWLGSQRGAMEGKKTAPVAVKKINVVVATKAIAKGTHLEAGMLGDKPYEPDLVPTNAERILSEVVGRIAARDISQGDPITTDKLLPRGVTAAGLSNVVEPGKRAITVKGSKVLGSGGLITPGSRVDVVATFDVPGKGDVKVAKVILQDLPVLTTGTEMETRIGKDGREELASTDLFTLMVTPRQAERLALAADQGTLHFALRRTGDERPVVTPGTELGAMAGGVLSEPGGPEGLASGKSASAGPPPVPKYAYQAVRSSAPGAAASESTAGKTGGGAASAPSMPAPSAIPGMPGGQDQKQAPASASTGVAGAREASQGSDRIMVYDVTIECPTCPR